MPKLRDHRARRIRQVDVAREAGVSQATVSMALADQGVAGNRATAATRQRVQDVAQRLGYSVNPVARNLVGGRNRLIGVYTFEPIFSAEGRDYHQESWGIERAAESAGYDLLLFTSAAVSDQRRKIYAGGVNRLSMSDGSILFGRNDDKAEIERLCADGFPFVYIGRRELSHAEMSYVTADYARATKDVVRHLAELGHRAIAYLGIAEMSEPDVDRQAGWTAALSEFGLDQARLFRPEARAGSPTLMDLHGAGFTAAVIEDPKAAAHLMAVARDAGLRVPGDLSVAVLGDDPAPARTATGEGSWTGFRIPHEEMGRTAVSMLLELLADPERRPLRRCLTCLVETGSTAGAAPTGGPARGSSEVSA